MKDLCLEMQPEKCLKPEKNEEKYKKAPIFTRVLALGPQNDQETPRKQGCWILCDTTTAALARIIHEPVFSFEILTRSASEGQQSRGKRCTSLRLRFGLVWFMNNPGSVVDVLVVESDTDGAIRARGSNHTYGCSRYTI